MSWETSESNAYKKLPTELSSENIQWKCIEDLLCIRALRKSIDGSVGKKKYKKKECVKLLVKKSNLIDERFNTVVLFVTEIKWSGIGTWIPKSDVRFLMRTQNVSNVVQMLQD